MIVLIRKHNPNLGKNAKTSTNKPLQNLQDNSFNPLKNNQRSAKKSMLDKEVHPIFLVLNQFSNIGTKKKRPRPSLSSFKPIDISKLLENTFRIVANSTDREKNSVAANSIALNLKQDPKLDDHMESSDLEDKDEQYSSEENMEV
ncbi:hypothetical protein VNO78_20442 [Psophocarpus tetragonolobus]|uniref:Uncharacterized protein n=1 Tax=Psophocarpus tetragonolobus TaxID=3891 RepID=A0AAN9XH77_PSOTE